jgi:glycerol-3-phosphate cytidylyltransferase-like family protein
MSLNSIENYLFDLFESALFEREKKEMLPKDSNATKVVALHGRFTVPHVGHIGLMELAYKEGKKKGAEKLIVAIVMGKKSSMDKDKNPTTFDQRKRLIDKALKIPHEVIEIPIGFTGEVINSCRSKGYEPVVLVAGPDRIQAYKDHMKKYGEEWESDAIVTGVKGDRLADGASATKVRDAIRADDQATFKKFMSKELHSEWKNLKKI